jgi:lipopolysaccharide biosynthesis glycosyltransferase
VRDPIAAMILGIRGQPYFNAGFMVISPSQQIYNELMATEQHGVHFAEQDTLNEYFKDRWQKLPKACNWLLYKENHPTAVTDPRVFAIHKL